MFCILGRVNMILLDEENLTVLRIVNDSDLPDERAMDYDWNLGGTRFRNAMIQLEAFRENLTPNLGFRVYYYGIGQLKHK